jgi:excisionase family DNA binding protein
MGFTLVDCPGVSGFLCCCTLVNAPMTEPWVSVDDLAHHLGVTKDSVYRWIERKGLPARKIGKLWKFKLSEVDDWVRRGAASQATPDRDDR